MQAFYLDTVESTNDLARSMLRDGKIRDAAYIVARRQTAGRGNRGRTWLSPLDAGIYLTVIDRPRIAATGELHAFTRAAGIACAETLHAHTGIAVRLKPINDLYVDGRKLGGILTEAVIEQHELRALITGVGLNVRKADRPLPSDQVQPICLEELMTASAFDSMDVRGLTFKLVERIRLWNTIVAAGNRSALESQWQQHCLDPGMEISNSAARIPDRR
jgi:BirA family biotin operon repressor/biotin-[acetyl-CoA-carboxylase] ligase